MIKKINTLLTTSLAQPRDASTSPTNAVRCPSMKGPRDVAKQPRGQGEGRGADMERPRETAGALSTRQPPADGDRTAHPPEEPPRRRGRGGGTQKLDKKHKKTNKHRDVKTNFNFG